MLGFVLGCGRVNVGLVYDDDCAVDIGLDIDGYDCTFPHIYYFFMSMEVELPALFFRSYARRCIDILESFTTPNNI